MNIKDLLKLAGKQGKVVVVNDQGDVQGVFVPYDAYQKMAGVSKPAAVKADETEKVNRAILDAQLAEEAILSAAESVTESTAAPPGPAPSPVERLDTILSKRAEEFFRSIPYNYSVRPPVDMRSEVMDPNYDYNAPENPNDDEVIKPSFDDI